LILLSLILYITCVNALNPVCRGKLRSDLQFKYSYDSHIIDSSKDLDFNQRGNLARCASSGTQIYTDSTMGSVNCDSIATGEGPGLDRFGWASQTMVGKEGKVKFYTPFDSLASVDQEFTTGTKCGTKVILPTGAVWGAAVCEKAVHLYFYDDTQWLDRGEIAFPDATGNDIDIDVNHEDYLIARAGSKVFIYKLGMFPEKIHEENGDGLVAASVNCKGSVFAYESSGSIKLKQLDQSDGTSWSNLADVASSAISMEMSSDVLAVGTTGKVQLYLFANGGTSYDEYKAIDGLSAKNFGKKLALKHDDLAVADDDNIYLFKEITPTKCRQNQKLVNGECVACEGTESSALDTTSSTCTPLTCAANQYISGGACTACPGDYTSAGGSVTECVCAAGKFIDANSDCTSCPAGSSSAAEGSTECVCTGAGKTWDPATEACVGIKCAADEHVQYNTCVACSVGTTNEAEDDSSGANTDCDVTVCAENEHRVSHVCTPCPVGGSRAAGDLATEVADTACAPDHTCTVNQFYLSDPPLVTRTSGSPSTLTQTECEALPGFGVTNAFNQFGDHPEGCIEVEFPVGTFTINYNTDTGKNCDVLNNAKCLDGIGPNCNDCPAGSNKSPAVDSMGGDSTCDAILCAENEHVASNVCTACPAGSERAAGDDATGADTQCNCKVGYEGDGTTCTECGTNQESAGSGDTCKCSAGTEGDGTDCQSCPANSNAIAGHIKDICVRNEAAIWKDVEPDPVNHGKCDDALDCSTLVGDPSTCIQPYEDGGVLQLTSPCCQIEKKQKCTCDENFRVASGVCTACIGGKTRPAGDDPDGVNTYCSTEGIGLAFGNNGSDHYTHLGDNEDPTIELKVGQKYSFLRDSAGHPLRIVSEEDCDGKGCDTGTYTSLPTSSVSNVDAVQGVANIVWRPKRAGTYYYLCTAHPAMLGTITVVWDTCDFPLKGAFLLTQSCMIKTDITLDGDMAINLPSARLRSTGEKPLLSYEAQGEMSIISGSYNFEMHNVEVQPPEESDALIKGSGDFVLNNVDIKESGEWRDSDRDGVFTSNGGKIVAQNMAIHNVAGLSFKATGGGDVSLADVTISGSYTGNSESYSSGYDFSEAVIGVKGGAITMRNVQMTGGWKLAQMEDATSLFEAVTMDGNKGIKGKNTAIQMERSTIKNLDGDDAIDLDNSGQDNKDKELFISNSTIKDNRGDTNGPISVKVHSTTSYRSKIKLIEVDFSGNKKADNTARDIYSNNAASLYVVDPVSDPTVSGPSLKEECYDHQCAHKPLASTCKVEAGKGTKCSCEVGVATYNSGTMSFERQTHLKEVLATLFATADVGDRIVKLVDRQSRYTPASATPEEAKSNLILTKPTNTDGKFVSEKTILMKPATGQLCTSFRTWLCNELTMCHYSNGTITAECDNVKILTPSSNAATRRLRSIHKWKVLKAVHPDDPNCAGTITNLKQQCTANVNGNAESYERCVRGAHFVFNDCKCQDGTVPNSGLTACVNPNDACRQNERVFQGRCIACPAGTSNIAGDDRTGSNTVCDDVVCSTKEYADGTGLCKPCPSGEYNIAGDIAFNKGTGATITTSCCPASEYETAYTLSDGTRTCAACSGIQAKYTTDLKCCSGQKLGDATYAFQCPRIMEYWRNVCSQVDNTCPARNY
jgi:hypothetical protein